MEDACGLHGDYEGANMLAWDSSRLFKTSVDEVAAGG